MKMEKKEEDYVVIRIKRSTREKLAKLGRKNDTYDDIINKFISKK